MRAGQRLSGTLTGSERNPSGSPKHHGTMAVSVLGEEGPAGGGGRGAAPCPTP